MTVSAIRDIVDMMVKLPIGGGGPILATSNGRRVLLPIPSTKVACASLSVCFEVHRALPFVKCVRDARGLCQLRSI
jgi:hypothetical protein